MMVSWLSVQPVRQACVIKKREKREKKKKRKKREAQAGGDLAAAC